MFKLHLFFFRIISLLTISVGKFQLSIICMKMHRTSLDNSKKTTHIIFNSKSYHYHRQNLRAHLLIYTRSKLHPHVHTCIHINIQIHHELMFMSTVHYELLPFYLHHSYGAPFVKRLTLKKTATFCHIQLKTTFKKLV